jgi:hypothetical protein
MQRSRLETAAASYSYLRGLLFLPVGLLCIVAALGNWEVGPLRHAWAFLLAVGLIGAACLRISRYYNDNYGRLSPSTRQQARAAVAVVLGVAVMIGGSALLRSHAAWSLDLPVNAIAICFAVVMLISYGIGVGLKVHHLIVWGGLLVIGALPIWNGPDPSNIGLVLAGLGIMISGVFDHRLFVQTFGPARALRSENGDVAA